MAFQEVVNEFIRLSEAESKERTAKQNQHPLGRSAADIVAEMGNPRPAHDALRKYLAALPMPTLRAIEVLMYAGRENDDPINTAKTLTHDDDNGIMATMVSSKVDRVKYVQGGIANLKGSLDKFHDAVVKYEAERK